MATTSLAFANDKIENLADYTYVTGSITSTTYGITSMAPGSANYIFNYGTAVSISASAGDSALISITLSLEYLAPTTSYAVNHDTLFIGGTSLTMPAGTAGTFFATSGSPAAMTALLDNAYVIDNTQNDNFSIILKATDNGSSRSADMQYSTACFTAGTRIATPDGERTVEALAAGDMVATPNGEHRVAWIGKRSYEADMMLAEPWLRPVEIRRGALGRGLPRRDLRVSPEHAMLIDGALVRAAALVNGRTIFHAPVTGDVTYYHVELENEHGILFAEGAATESFRDEGSRVLFENAAEYTLAHGTETAMPALAAPRVDDGYQLETIRHRLAGGMDEVPAGSIRGHVERLTGGVLEGWIMDAANPLVPVEIEVRVEGKPVGRTIANRYRTDLHAAGIGVGRAGFRFVLPTGCDELGAVEVVRAFDGARLPVAEPATA